MEKNNEWYAIGKDFCLSDEALYQFTAAFREDMEAALAGKESSLSADRTFIGLPTGREGGRYIAVDFGGSTLRAARILLTGKGYYVIERKAQMPLVVPGKHDFTSKSATAEELFDALADLVSQVADKNKHYVLGHTFSFAVEQHELGDGKLLSWVKEIGTSGVEGKYVNQLLTEALKRRGYTLIRPVALLNDTTATLLTAAYANEICNVAVICGTGFNMCFYDNRKKEIVNLEAGEFSRLTRSAWDLAVDKETQHPGRHLLEKMLSGAYLGRIFRRLVMAYFKTDQIPHISTETLANLIRSESPQETRRLMSAAWGRILTFEDTKALSNLGASVFVRSAQLMGAAVAAVLLHMYGHEEVPDQTIAVDGSVCTRVRGCLPVMTEAAFNCFHRAAGNMKEMKALPEFLENSSLVGAAIAAAIVMRDRE